MNILVGYLYRDSGNNKTWGDFVFSNKSRLSVSGLDTEIKESLLDGSFFVSEKVLLPDLSVGINKSELDHGWHEYSYILETVNLCNDKYNRDISDFVDALKFSKIS